MKDISSDGPLVVSTDGGVGPYIMVAMDQLDGLVGLLKKHNISIDVEDDAISIDDEPFFIVVNLGRKGNARQVQEILDSVP